VGSKKAFYEIIVENNFISFMDVSVEAGGGGGAIVLDR